MKHRIGRIMCIGRAFGYDVGKISTGCLVLYLLLYVPLYVLLFLEKRNRFLRLRQHRSGV